MSGRREKRTHYGGNAQLPRRAVYLPQVDDASGLPVDADAPQRRRKMSHFSETVARILKYYKLSISAQAMVTDEMLHTWPEIAGKELAARLTLDKFEDGILYALARNNTELFELRAFHLRTLEAKLKKHPAFKAMKQLRIRCG